MDACTTGPPREQIERVEEFAEVAQSLLIGVVALAGLIVVVAMNLLGKARAFEDTENHGPERSLDAATNVDLPSPQFNRRDPTNRRGM